MIEYDPHECFGVGLLFKLAGSVIPRNLAKTLVGVLVCMMVGSIQDNPEPLSYSPYGERVTCTVLGLLLVFRTSFALQRFWEARSCLQRVASLLSDVARDAKSFSVSSSSLACSVVV